ncbi:GntR family transcriptional regulator [Clostridium sp. AM58-1XD]|uniref:GntR family transcriptional regulator n=1 Tax=Clostridium sp. AM58-1XD TaxID=2292307 RepID=UPI000E550AD7|nr:GntR family transcriptional regulator [Clostridium sp. AM58-1XD]RGZ00644.1 GntR family transcriptional regulator [Clostridium sp. AM58-1XD]
MSKTDYAYDIIKEQIVSGKLKPSEELSEKVFQEKLSVSRTPIREAFQTLHHEGFIEIHPRKSILVAPVTFHLLEQIFDTRIMLEPQLFKRACGKIEDEKLLDMRWRLLNPPDHMSSHEQEIYYNNLDLELHSSVVPYINNLFIENTFRIVQDHETRIRNILFNIDTNSPVIEEHVSIINALLQRSESEIVSQVTIHTENARKKAFLYFFDHTI